MDMTQAMQAVENTMIEIVASDVDTLRDASRHILSAGGKRVRPRLVLLSYAATGGHDIDYVAPVAAAIELVHTASVVHDDINDHGSIRRGQPSVNAVWGRTFALLTGDFLFTKAYGLIAPHKDLNIILSAATITLVEGETLQAAAAKDGNLSRDVYYQIIARKTAGLFRAAARLGAELNNATREQVEALAQYGYNIGMAFQITDDILDLIADTEQLGKSTDLDLAQGKGFATAHVSNGNIAVADHAAHTAIAEDPLARIKAKVLEGNAIDEARAQAGLLAHQAIACLDPLPASSAKDDLIEMAGQIVERDY